MGLFSSNKNKVKFKGTTEDGREFNGEITLPSEKKEPETMSKPEPTPESVRRHSGCDEESFRKLNNRKLF